MLQPLTVGNRFHALGADDPDDSDNEATYMFGNRAERPLDEASSAGDTEFFDANDDACCFLSERIHYLESNGKSSIPSISLS